MTKLNQDNRTQPMKQEKEKLTKLNIGTLNALFSDHQNGFLKTLVDKDVVIVNARKNKIIAKVKFLKVYGPN